MLRVSLAIVIWVLAAAAALPTLATEFPSPMSIINGGEAPSPAETAQKNVLALNTIMFELYGDAGRVIGQNIRAQHPIILGLFSGAGGRLILYRPGQPPLDAPSVPPVYQLLKSIGHSTMAIAVAVGPALDKLADQSWLGSLQAYRARMQAGLASMLFIL